MDMSLIKVWKMVMDREASHAAAQGVTKSQPWLRDWTKALNLKELNENVIQTNFLNEKINTCKFIFIACLSD